jgi:hypothetical protein
MIRAKLGNVAMGRVTSVDGTPSGFEGGNAMPVAVDQYGRIITVDSGGGSGGASTFFSGVGTAYEYLVGGAANIVEVVTAFSGVNGADLPLFAQLYSSASNPLDGVTAPLISIPVPADFGTFTLGGSFSIPIESGEYCIAAISGQPYSWEAPDDNTFVCWVQYTAR